MAALGLRLYRLDAESLWTDELSMVRMYGLSPWQIVIKSAEHQQPPLDNLIGGGLVRLGLADSDWWVRLPAAVFGAVSVMLMGWFMRCVAGAWTGAAGAIFVAVCPLHVYMSQEVRPYTLFFSGGLATVIALARAIHMNRIVDWLLYAGALFLALLTRWTDPHFLTMGIILFTLQLWWTRKLALSNRAIFITMRIRRIIVFTVSAYAVYAPLFVMIFLRSLRSVGAQESLYWARLFRQLATAYIAMLHGYSTRTLFAALPGPAWLLGISGILAVTGLIILGTLAVKTRRLESRLFLWVMCPFAFLYAGVYAGLSQAIPKPQYLLFGAVCVFGCSAVCADALRRRFMRFGRLSAAAAYSAIVGTIAIPMASASLAGLSAVDKPDWRGVMSLLRKEAKPADAFAVVGTDTAPSTFYLNAFGVDRYGPAFARFLPITLVTDPGALWQRPWTAEGNSAWIVGYTDRMYLGVEHLPSPEASPSREVHRFNGLFVMRLNGVALAASRLVQGLQYLLEQTPHKRGLTGPGMFAARYHSLVNNDMALAEASEMVLQQAQNEAERAYLAMELSKLEPRRAAAGDSSSP